MDNKQKAEPSDRELPETEPSQSSEPQTYVPNETASQLKVFQESIERVLSDLVNLVESRLAYDAVKEKAFDRLYAEMDEVKQDREFEQLRPFFADLVLLFDRLDHLRNESPETEDVSSIIVSIREELVEILSRRGIDMIPSREQFDPAFQHALRMVATNDEDNNNRIARIVRHGFRYGSRVIRHEEVFVYRFLPSEPDPDIEDSKRECESKAVSVEKDETVDTIDD